MLVYVINNDDTSANMLKSLFLQSVPVKNNFPVFRFVRHEVIYIRPSTRASLQDTMRKRKVFLFETDRNISAHSRFSPFLEFIKILKQFVCLTFPVFLSSSVG